MKHILLWLLLEYNTITICSIYIVVCSLNVASIQLLNCKNGWTSGNLDYILQFLTVYIFFSLLFKLVFQNEKEMFCYRNAVTHCNTIKHNTALTPVVSHSVYVCVCVHVCMYVCVHAYMYVCTLNQDFSQWAN